MFLATAPGPLQLCTNTLFDVYQVVFVQCTVPSLQAFVRQNLKEDCEGHLPTARPEPSIVFQLLAV